MSEMVPFEGDQEITDFEYGQFGNLPELTKEDYNGKVIVVVGVSTEEFVGQFDEPAKSLLHLMPDEPLTQEPWGLLFGKSSPVLTQASGQLQKNGGRPFFARIIKVQGRTFPYWTLEPVRRVYNTDGQIAGFRLKDGTMIDNSEAPTPMPERKPKK